MFIVRNIIRNIISKAVLIIEICEKYKTRGMLLISRIKIFENTSILWIHASWIRIRKHQSQIIKNERFQYHSLYKNTLAHIIPRNTTFVPKFSMLPVDSVL